MSIHKVLNNAELLGLILALVDTSTCACIASTSSNFFKQGIVHVWKNLATAKPLLLLIPGAQEVELEGDETTINLPPPPADFLRFDFYAFFVRSLTTVGTDEYGDSYQLVSNSSWQTLALRAQESTLLPNLKELRLNHHFKQENELALYASIFTSPSLIAFNAVKIQLVDTIMPSSTMTSILRLLAHGCPHLELLAMYIGPPNNTQDNSPFLNPITEEPASRTWRKFQNLSSLAVDASALDADTLSSLGQLPCLVSLGIRGILLNYYSPPERLPSSVSDTILSKDSFPSLRRLALYRMHYEDTITIWNLRPLVEELAMVRIYVQRSSEEATIAAQLATELLPLLSTHSPQLTDLYINFVREKVWDRSLLPVDIEYFKCLGRLPLQRVEVEGAFLCNPGTDNHLKPSFAGQIAALWPKVVELKLLDQEVTLGHLHHFATLLTLRHIVLDIHWDDDWEVEGRIEPASGDLPFHTLESSRKVTKDFLFEGVEEIAKYLVSFWPKLGEIYVPSDDDQVPSLDMLRLCIRTFQGLAETKLRIM
ncbi:hypothetical protein BDV93DRAFT_588422 [Ceratobasidium sp. AG-I]|nr:hypothetical protein BDV93DRAFT_588422 [Ceratobasidium sp. AG-I]